MKETVPLELDDNDANRLLSRLYADRYDDVDKTPVALEVDTEEAIEKLEEKFPDVAANFGHNE